jgi:hypothetical protein
MLTWVPIATNESPTGVVRGRLPQASAAVVGSNVVFRFSYFLSVTTTAAPFASEADAFAWVEANRLRDER